MKRVIALVLIVVMVVLLSTGCNGSTEEPETKPQPVTGLSKPDQTKWRYNGEFDIYYQSCIGYCEKPADEQYEQLAVFVPGAYMDANDNGDGTFTCKVSESAELNGYSATTAPILMPIDTPGYAAARALNDEILTQHQGIFEQLSDYTSQGFVLVLSACRGINEGAPAGVTDLKAAIRYIRYADDVLAGDAESSYTLRISKRSARYRVYPTRLRA